MGSHLSFDCTFLIIVKLVIMISAMTKETTVHTVIACNFIIQRQEIIS